MKQEKRKVKMDSYLAIQIEFFKPSFDDESIEIQKEYSKILKTISSPLSEEEEKRLRSREKTLVDNIIKAISRRHNKTKTKYGE